MKFCMEVYFLTINKKVKVTTGVIFSLMAVAAGGKTAALKKRPILTGKRYVVDLW